MEILFPSGHEADFKKPGIGQTQKGPNGGRVISDHAARRDVDVPESYKDWFLTPYDMEGPWSIPSEEYAEWSAMLDGDRTAIADFYRHGLSPAQVRVIKASKIKLRSARKYHSIIEALAMPEGSPFRPYDLDDPEKDPDVTNMIRRINYAFDLRPKWGGYDASSDPYVMAGYVALTDYIAEGLGEPERFTPLTDIVFRVMNAAIKSDIAGLNSGALRHIKTGLKTRNFTYMAQASLSALLLNVGTVARLRPDLDDQSMGTLAALMVRKTSPESALGSTVPGEALGFVGLIVNGPAIESEHLSIVKDSDTVATILAVAKACTDRGHTGPSDTKPEIDSWEAIIELANEGTPAEWIVSAMI